MTSCAVASPGSANFCAPSPPVVPGNATFSVAASLGNVIFCAAASQVTDRTNTIGRRCPGGGADRGGGPRWRLQRAPVVALAADSPPLDTNKVVPFLEETVFTHKEESNPGASCVT